MRNRSIILLWAAVWFAVFIFACVPTPAVNQQSQPVNERFNNNDPKLPSGIENMDADKDDITTPDFGQNSADEARKYLVRGMTAIETSKGNDGLAQAAKEFKKATKIAPTMAAAWYNLGSVQSKIGQLEAAIASYRRYLSLAPKADDAQQVRDDIVRLEYKLERAEANVLKRDGRFIAYIDGTVLDTKTNLMWAAKDNGSSINWEDARLYCENYRGGGYTDWRMPTQDELAGLYNASKNYQSECRSLFGTYDTHLTELIHLSCCMIWASGGKGDWADDFIFKDGRRFRAPREGSGDLRALPVRSAR
jgi:tetratricopeptide (TPR) repeat protein